MLDAALRREARVVTTGDMPSYPAWWLRTTFAARWVAILTVPLSLISAGATISMSLVALYGVIAIVRGARLTPRLRRVHWFMTACYVLLLATDLLNGDGILRNLASTGFNYLHLFAVAPLALAFRLIDLDDGDVDWMLYAGVWGGLANSLFSYFILDMSRPGGPSLNPIPYGFIIAMWGVFLLARGLERGPGGRMLILSSAVAIVPVVLTESKIAWIVMIVGYALTVIFLAWKRKRFGFLWKGALVAIPTLVIAYFALAHRRIELFAHEVETYATRGELTEGSFGYRWELLRASWRAVLDRPWFGHGIVERKTAAFAYADPEGPDITVLGHLHNDYITHAVAFGVPGIVFIFAFLAFFVAVGRGSWRLSDSAIAYAVMPMLAIYMVADVVFNMDPMSGSLTIALALLLIPKRDEVASIPAIPPRTASW